MVIRVLYFIIYEQRVDVLLFFKYIFEKHTQLFYSSFNAYFLNIILSLTVYFLKGPATSRGIDIVLEEAEAALTRAEEILTRSLGEAHYLTALCHVDLSLCYAIRGNITNALVRLIMLLLIPILVLYSNNELMLIIDPFVFIWMLLLFHLYFVIFVNYNEFGVI